MLAQADLSFAISLMGKLASDRFVVFMNATLNTSHTKMFFQRKQLKVEEESRRKMKEQEERERAREQMNPVSVENTMSEEERIMRQREQVILMMLNVKEDWFYF